MYSIKMYIFKQLQRQKLLIDYLYYYLGFLQFFVSALLFDYLTIPIPIAHIFTLQHTPVLQHYQLFITYKG